jgi:hypothetical protein
MEGGKDLEKICAIANNCSKLLLLPNSNATAASNG